MVALQFAAPETLLGWATLLAVLAGMLGATGGLVVRLVKFAIAEAVDPVQLQLVTMNGEMERLSKIEQTVLEHQQVLNNGIGERTKRLEANQADFAAGLAELRGALLWSGEERRRS